MYSFVKPTLLVAALVSLSQAADYTDWMASSFMTKDVTFLRNYANGVLIPASNSPTINPRTICRRLGALIDSPGNKVSPDDIRLGLKLWLWTVTGESKYKTAADTLREHLNSTPRNNAGGFWHRKPTFEKTQDKSGGWWRTMDKPYPRDPRNYIESSATAMCTYGFLKGIRKGSIRAKNYMAPAKKAYNLMVDKYVGRKADGTLNWLKTVEGGSLGSNSTFEYYILVPVVQDY
ncbi:putative cell wall glycosyl hydrolase YteR [Aspergillus clavatus NRRL 1]|uniref:Cell wall glycosyl hydrolase YteR, putative n=1 Tax=Aspergillus clavatus (strain ATCC 1007 / CBS 513.65 / DSM 816 / NCTC 3887 / NRRL 1 / QM 1276 / 107) TaxID=344612 RepID=A1C783_ASPCL|nr:cell wall glycosyl hydrolase YteR, putative [Aspergillus clavatus NRRL 1]EAW14254.1 cell wall glycosyl hydrolase YteR, putative [Aspergillus clavatus NRRL 1]